MGGGAAMRAAANVAAIGVVSRGTRGSFSSISSPAEQSVRNAKLPVSAIISSSSQTDGGCVESEGFQKPGFDFDDWEFTGYKTSDEPLPRLVFGAPPSLEEAKAATDEVKDALEKVYMASSGSMESGGQLSGSSLVANSETKGYLTCDAKPTSAIKAFQWLNRSPQAQSIVASIAADSNVWDAVLKNEAVREYLLPQKTNLGSPRESSASCDDANPGEKVKNGAMDILENMKHTVVEMMSNVSSFVQQIFGFSPADKVSESADANDHPSFFDKTIGASFMALAVMVIMVVVMKRF